MGKSEYILTGNVRIDQKLAITAARSGDWTLADMMELEHMNRHKNPFGDSRWVAVALYRGMAPGGQIAVCWRRHGKDDQFTDIDGNEIEVDRSLLQ